MSDPAKGGFVVAIDGPAGAGKSTVARRLAEELDVPYLNTGIMYRSLARRALERGISPDDGAALAEAARSMVFSMDTAANPASLLVDGSVPGEGLAAAEVEAIVSRVSSHPEVRSVLRAEQRRLAASGGVVEGRDIGTVVFPDADVKVFLLADVEERAARRQAERGSDDPALADALARRDSLDAQVNPLVAAPDARRVDTSGRDPDDVLREVLELVRRRPVPGPADPSRPASRAPRVAIVGRQNVGKSTLLNRLLGAREAIADASPGVTRDRVEAVVVWQGRTFLAVDTGGYVRRARGVEVLVTAQADRAMAEADVVLLVVDAAVGIQEEDAALARRLRRAEVPVLLVANKVDAAAREADAAEFYRLGLGDPFPISALHGRGAGDLLDRIVDLLPPERELPGEPEEEPVFCIVGRPNVGKSSLFNRLVGEERAVVYEEAGTTRDSIDAVVPIDGRRVRFVDTAGFRRPSRAEGIEYYGFVRAVRAIDRADVAALVVAADEGVTTEDRRIAARVSEAGRGLVVLANKWDLVESEERPGRFAQISEAVEVFPGVPVLRTSARTGAGVGKVIPALVTAHGQWSRRVPTAEVNRVLHEAQGEHPPPRTGGRLLYGTQVGTGPPRFVIFTGGQLPPAYRRFLENRLRREFGFGGSPIRLSIRPRRKRGRSRG